MASRFVTPLQRRRITAAVRDGHLAFCAEMFGPTSIEPEDYARLVAAGKIRNEKLLPQDIALAAHSLGMMAGGALAQMRSEAEREHHARTNKLTPSEFWRQIRDDPKVITEAEREAVAILRDRIGQHVRGLSNKLDSITGQILTDVDDQLRRRRLTKLQREIAHGVEERAAVQEVERRLRTSIKELRRDWMRAAHTEMHNTMEEAKAIVLAHRSPDRDPRVFKRPRPDACKFCVMLFLRPDGKTPRVFKLSELLANGTNVGRRAGRPTRSGKSRTEWKAVIGAVHPFCQCPLHVLPDGMGFNAKGQMIYTGMNKSVPVEALDKALAAHECEKS